MYYVYCRDEEMRCRESWRRSQSRAEKESELSWLPIHPSSHQNTLPGLTFDSFHCIYHTVGHLKLCLQLCPFPQILQMQKRYTGGSSSGVWKRKSDSSIPLVLYFRGHLKYIYFYLSDIVTSK